MKMTVGISTRIPSSRTSGNCVRFAETLAANRSVPERSCSEDEKSRSCKSPSPDATPVAGGNTLCSDSHELINSEIFSPRCIESILIPVKKK